MGSSEVSMRLGRNANFIQIQTCFLSQHTNARSVFINGHFLLRTLIRLSPFQYFNFGGRLIGRKTLIGTTNKWSWSLNRGNPLIGVLSVVCYSISGLRLLTAQWGWYLSPGLNANASLISTSYLTGFFDIFILLHILQNCVCFGDFLPMRTLCDVYHKEFESH